MLSIPVTDHPSWNTDTRYPWMITVSDEPGDNAQEVVMLPDFPSPEGNIYTAPTPTLSPSQPYPASLTFLDRSNADVIHRKLSVLPPHRRYLLRLIDDRIAHHRLRFGILRHHEDNYRAKACLIATSDAPFRDKFCFCSIPNARNRAGTCEQRKFCPYCNYRVRERAQMAYVPAFSSGRWFSCTLSFSGMVNFEGFSGIGPSLYWDTCNHAVNALLDRGCVHGAYWAEELSLRALCPELLVLPHAHAVLHCTDDIARADDIRGFLEEQMATFLNSELLRDRGLRKIMRLLRLPPSVQVNPLATQRDLFFATGYVTKTIKLVQLYRDTRVMLGRREQWQANAQLEQFFAAWDCEMWQETRTGKPRTRRQIFRRGTLRSQSNSFVGLRKSDWWPQQERKRLRLLFARLMRQPSSWNPEGDDPFGIDAELESQETPISLAGSEEET